MHSEDNVKIFYLSNSNHLKQIEYDLRVVFKDTSFTKQDIDFFQLQIEQYRNFKWTSKKIKRAKIVSKSRQNRLYKNHKNWEKFHKNHGKSILGYSVPLFTCDKSKVVVYRAKYCGALCGGGQISVFEKINGKWSYRKNYGFWIG